MFTVNYSIGICNLHPYFPGIADDKTYTLGHICWESCNFPILQNVGLHDPKYRCAKNNIVRARGAKGGQVGVIITVSQLIMSGSVG